MIRKLLFTVILCAAIIQTAWALPVMPFRIGGFLTVNGEVITTGNDTAYTVRVTRQDGTLFNVKGSECVVGEQKGFYLIDIPIYNENSQPWGVNPGDTVILHVYNSCSEFNIVSPGGGEVVVGGSGSIKEIPIEAKTAPGAVIFYTQEQLDQAVQDALKNWDVGGDGQMGLQEAIRALRTVSGGN